MNLKAWREKRAAKKEAKRPYDVIEKKLTKKLLTLEPGTDEYEKIRKELKEVNIIRSESKESKRRISKEAKGGIIIKVLGLIGGAVGLGSIIFAEREGMTFTGEKRTVMDAISRAIGNVLTRK